MNQVKSSHSTLQIEYIMILDPVCNIARTVISDEIESLSALLNRIDREFVKACHILYSCTGRIIVMGIGKSGHIGRKIAATFASTGSPAFFIHPSEAKHGDCGMITRQDVVVMLSNSGETEELLCILPFIKRFGLSLITLTGNPASQLAQAATINMDVSVTKEACPLGLAPTSSTTATLVMGDALAIALLTQRGFTKEDFALSHPGGILGRKLLLKAADLMHSGSALPIIATHATIKTALLEISQKKLGMTIIVHPNQELAGIFTDGDVRRFFELDVDFKTALIKDFMTLNPKTIRPDTQASDALQLMEKNKITSLVVLNDKNQPVGVIHLHDILQTGIR